MSFFSWLQRKWDVHRAVRENSRRQMAAKLKEARAELELEKRRAAHDENVKSAIVRNKLTINEVFMQRMESETTASGVRANVAGSYHLPIPQWSVERYTPPVKVCPATHVLAMDDAYNALWGGTGFPVEMTGMGFPGYPYLNELMQLTEYRDIIERTAKEMTRKWIKFRATGDDKRDEQIEQIEAEFKRLKVRQLFRRGAELDGSNGRGHIFIDMGESEGAELESNLMLNKFKIRPGSLRRLKIVEAMFTYPASYNAAFPLRANFYEPSAWYVMGQMVDASRLLTFISRPLPDMLKPVYNFSGMSLSQLAQPYVDYWLNTRESVGALLRNFSCSVLKTDMGTIMAGSDDPNVINRAKMFNWFRNNGGLMLLDFEKEEFEKHETSLAGLDKLQAQAQEHMAAVAKTPIVVLFGITPTGLNVTAEGDMKVYYDYIGDMQEALFRPNLDILLQIVQLSLWGKIYEDITYDFEPLMTMTGKEQALISKSKTDEAVGLIEAGVVSPEEVRGKIAADPDSGWDGLDVEHVEGTLTPSAAKPGKGGSAGGGAGGVDPSMQAAENTPDAAQVSMDGAVEQFKLWNGNQHTGGMGPGEGPLARASKASALAVKKSHAADKVGSRAAHLKALKAHQRALDAHKSALESAEGHPRIVHQSYIDAHMAALDKHARACADAPEEDSP